MRAAFALILTCLFATKAIAQDTEASEVVSNGGENAGEEVVADFSTSEGASTVSSPFRESRHTNNWAVLVSTSRFWFNYRHMANVLSFYRTVKRLGIPDSQIIVMLSDDISCNPRNPFVGSVYKDHERTIDIYGSNVEVDFRGYEVTVENFVRLLTDRWDDDMPRSKRLMTDDRSNVLIYLTGHGGNDFLKFQDAEEIGAWDLADAFGQMWEKRRYNELLFMIDTCEANTMYSKCFSPNMIAVGSSQIQESSYANSSDDQIGVSLIDRFTSLNLKYLEQVDKQSNLSLADLFNSYDPVEIESHPGIRSDLFPYPLESVRITDFFGNIQGVVVDEPEMNLDIDLSVYSEHQRELNNKTKVTRSEETVREPVRQKHGKRPGDIELSWSGSSMLASLAAVVGIVIIGSSM